MDVMAMASKLALTCFVTWHIPNGKNGAMDFHMIARAPYVTSINECVLREGFASLRPFNITLLYWGNPKMVLRRGKRRTAIEIR